MQISVETDRFMLRELVDTDAAGMLALDSNPAVHRYLGNRPLQTIEQALAVIQFVRQQYLDNGIGRWAIIDKLTRDFVGWAGLKLVREPINNHVDYYDIGYRLREEYWGQGIATETARAALRYGFSTLQPPVIYGMCHVENHASFNVLQKIGLRPQHTVLYDGAEHYWLRIT